MRYRLNMTVWIKEMWINQILQSIYQRGQFWWTYLPLQVKPKSLTGCTKLRWKRNGERRFCSPSPLLVALMICCSSPVGWSHIITWAGFRRRWGEEQRLSGWITKAPSNYVWHHYREPAKKTNDKICSPWVSTSDNWVVAAFSHSWALNQKYTPQAAKSSIGLHDNTNWYF